MSAALVRQSLALVDDDFKEKGKTAKKSYNVVNQLIPESHRIKGQIKKKGKRVQKVDLLQSQNKYTVIDAKKNHKSKDKILKNNLEKLKLIRKACRIDLDEDITKQIIERAVTKRPINKAQFSARKEETTAFTEEDFKKFEEEYFDEG